MPNYKFCPDCSTLLSPTEKSENDIDENDENDKDENLKLSNLYLVCNECMYSEKALTFSVVHSTRKVEKTMYANPKRLVQDYMYDVTLPRTMQKPCVNPECETKGKANPEIILITSEKHPEIANLCTVCKNIWGNF